MSVLILLISSAVANAALTSSLSPSNATVGVTNAYLVGTATPGATVSESETWPDGTIHGPYTTTANGSGTYSMGPFMLQQLGTYNGTVHDSISGATISISYSGTGNFNALVNTTNQTVTRGNSATYNVTVSSLSGFSGTVNLAALNWSQIPGATAYWSTSSVTVPSGSSAQASFTIQTSSSTTAGTYSNIQFRETNGSFSATLTVSLTVNAPAATLTASLSPSNPTVGVTNANIVGSASPGATISETETWPDGTSHGPYTTAANSSGNYALGPFVLQQLGTYSGTVRDSITGSTVPISYTGAGNFNASVNATTQTVTRGNAATFTVIVSSVSGFAGTVNLAALNWSQIPGATGSWSSSSVIVPSGSSAQATFTIQTTSSTTAGTYNNIQFRPTNGSFSSTLTVSVTVNAPAATLTAALSPSNATVGVTNANIAGTATAGATVSETETWPDGTSHTYSTTANGSGSYTLGPFIIQQLGTYNGTLRDSVTGSTVPISYSGTGNFSASVNTTSQTVTRGNAASFTVTFSSVSGFAGTVIPAALNWSQIPAATASWSPQSVTVPSNSSATATFTIQTTASTTAGTYSNIALQGANGSVTQSAAAVRVTVNAPAATLTASLSPSNATVGATNTNIVGTGTPGATVSETEMWPDGTSHTYSTTANGSGNYTLGPFIIQQIGTYNGTVRDSVTGSTVPISYSGTGNFSASVNTTSQTVTRGNAASFTVTFSSVSGFAGTVIPAALNWSQIPAATASWSPQSVTVPSNSSATATFTIQTTASTTAGTYSNIALQGANGSVTQSASAVRVTVNAPAATLTASLSPSNATVGVTNTNIAGTATPGATVSETETWPDGTSHTYSTTANGSGNYTLGPFIIQQLGTYNGTVRDSVTGSTVPISYTGTGNFSASVNTTSQTVTRGNAASFTVTFSSVSGFAGTVFPAALNWPQIPAATASWSPQSVTVPSNSSATATFTIQTTASTTAGTYSNITLQGANGSVTHAVSPVSVTVSGGTATLASSLSPSNATVGVTNAYLVGTASPGATVSENETWPDGTTHGPYTTTANGSGNYSMGPFIIQQLGTYNGTVRDSISGSSIPITYSGTGDFSVLISASSQTVTKGSAASFTLTFSSVSGFTGTVIPAALNWSQIPGATASWSPQSVTVPSNSSATATLTIQTTASTAAGTYSNITLQGANGSVTHTALLVSVTVTGGTATPTSSLSPSNATVGVTNAYLVGSATPGATVSESEAWPDGTTHGPYTTTANGSGSYSMGPFIIQQLGTYNGTVRDSISGSSIPITYGGAGDFGVSVSTGGQTVAKGQAATFTVTFTSVSGFAGTVIPAALNWSQISGATASWSPQSVTVPSNSSATATFTIQTASGTTAGTYSNIILQGANGSVTHAATAVSVTVTGGTSTLTSSLSPANATVGVANAYLVGTASPGATVSETETWPDGTTHGPYTATANSSGSYSMGPFVIQQLGTYTGTVRDSISGSSIPITYSGAGDFSVSAGSTSQTVAKGQSATFTVTFSSVSGFAGTVTPAALNWSQILGATASWSPQSVTVPSNSSATATFTIQTASYTTAGTYGSITLQGGNGSVTHGASPVSVTVSGGSSGTLTSSLSPGNATVGVTNASLVGTASPGATVTETETWPDGTTHGPYTTTANSSGSYSLGPFIIQQLGAYTGTVKDSISGSSIPVAYTGTGDFSVSVSGSSQTITKGQSATFTVTFSSVSGFAGTVIPVALNWSQIPGATASWSPQSITVPSNSSATATFAIQTTGSTTAGTYSNIVLQGANGSVTHAATPVSVIVNGGSGTVSGTLKASPTTCQVTPPATTCAISLLWTLQNTTKGEISVMDVLGKEQIVGLVNGTSGTQPIPWLQALPQSYTFYLWDYSNGSRGSQVASAPVSATNASGSTNTPAVSVNPPRNTPGSSFTILGSGLAAGQATIFVQPPGATANSVAQVNVGSDGTFNYPFTTQTSSAAGVYTVWAADVSGKKSSYGTFTLYQPTPASIPTCQSNTTTSGCNGDPINTATGNYTYQRTDLTIPGRGLPFVFMRTYNSEDGTPGPMGAGWTHSYRATLAQNSDGSVTVRMPDGQVVVFDPAGGGYISRFNGVYSTLQSPSSGTFVLTTKTQISYTFNGGQLATVSDRNGNSIQLTYSGGILTAINDTAGRRLAISADPAGRITQVLDPAGRSLQYQYDGAGNLVAFTDAKGGKYTYTYDGAHRMLTAVDPVGNTFLTNAYDNSGRAASQADGMGNLWTYSYDPNTLVTTITDPNGKTSSHLHDSKFQLLRATDTLGKNDQYQYDSLGNRISLQDRNGNTSRFNYDSNGNVIAATDAQASIQAAAYDAQSNPLSRTDALGNQATFSYDAKGNLVASIDPLSAKTTFTYESHGLLLSKTDPLGRTTKYSYDNSGNLTQVTDPLGNQTTYDYDSVGRRISMTDANGFTTSTAYDDNDNVVAVTDALGNKIQYEYDADNNRTKVTDPRNKATSYTYDGNSKLLITTDALGNKVTNAYDKLRNLASVTDQRGNTTRYGYDSENRLSTITDPLGNTTKYGYDGSGNRTSVVDALGNVTTYGYDLLNRQIAIKNALGNQSTTVYDADGHVVQKMDPSGNKTAYAYDSLGRQSSMTDAAGGQVTFQYDKVGNRTSITDARGKTTQFTYDGLNRVLTTTDPLGNVTTNQYDPVGNFTQVTDGNGNSKAYQYDGNRRQTKITYSTGGTIQFTYDVNGNRTQMVDLVGTSKYAYDDLNRLQSYTSPAGAALGFAYDEASNRTQLQYPGGKTVQYTYDAGNRISKMTAWNTFAVSYVYDQAGRITGVNYSNGLASQFTYDALGQNLKIQHTNSGTMIYSEATTWSPNGNPTSSDISGLTSPGLQSESTSNTYNDANELASVTYGAPVSDKNGNLTIQPGFGVPTTFTYDLNNRVTNIVGPSVNANIKYFGDGKLAEFDTASASHRYLIDPTASGNRILAELDATGALQSAYIQGPRGIVSQLSGGQTYVYVHNLQGSTASVLDTAGVVRNSYRYDPFGKKLPQSSEQIPNPFGFLGAFSVPTVGQYSITTYRAYDSTLGRFTGQDPLRLSQPSISPYLYASQGPLRAVDPSGLMAQPTTGTAGSTPASLLGVNTTEWTIDDYLEFLSRTGDIANFTLQHTVTGWKLIPKLPAGSFSIKQTVALPDWLDKLGNVVSLATYGVSTVQDFTDPNLSPAARAGNLVGCPSHFVTNSQ